MGTVTDTDARDLAEAERLIQEGRALRTRVKARIRVRRHRANQAKEIADAQ